MRQLRQEKKITLIGPIGNDTSRANLRHLWGEIISLVRYSNFINQYNEDNTFVNEVGRIITEISEQYNLDSFDGNVRAENKLYKVLSKNPIYSSVRKSFEKANMEYVRTHVKFRNSEQDRKEAFDKKNTFKEEMKVEDIPSVKRDKITETKGKEEIERVD